MNEAGMQTPTRVPQSPKTPRTPTSPPLSSEINSLSDHQLKKLTRSNTRRNLGGRKKRFLSQLERVCRRLELINLSSPVSPEPLTGGLHALPIVNPDGSSHAPQVDKKKHAPRIDEIEPQPDQLEEQRTADLRMPRRAQTPRFAKDSPFVQRDPTPNSQTSVSPASSTDEDDYAIEPATVCVAHEDVTSTTLTTKSFRSVRISTEVTIIGYGPQNRTGEPLSLSVSTMRRTEHPTRTGRGFHLNGRLGNDNRFPRAMSAMERNRRIRMIDSVSRDCSSSGSGKAPDVYTRGAQSSKPTLRTQTDSPGRSQPGGQLTNDAGASPKAGAARK